MTHDYRVPVTPEMKAQLNEIAQVIRAGLPAGWGFALFLFQYGEGGDMVWISSADRTDMLAALQEFIRKQGA